MKLSIIVPVFNRERLVGATLRSILRQGEAAELDIIVVDDGSTDGSADVVRGFIDQGAPIRLHSQPNGGVTKARNAGLRLLPADAEFVSFVDSDDISPAGRFAADLAHFAADPQIELTYALMQLVDRFDEDNLEPLAGGDEVVVRGLSLSCGIYRRSLIERIGHFDEELVQSEDTDYILRIFEQRARHVVSDTVAVYYRQHPHSLMSNRAVVKREFLRACHKSMVRRRRDPSLGSIDDFIKFDLQAMKEAR